MQTFRYSKVRLERFCPVGVGAGRVTQLPQDDGLPIIHAGDPPCSSVVGGTLPFPELRRRVRLLFLPTWERIHYFRKSSGARSAACEGAVRD